MEWIIQHPSEIIRIVPQPFPALMNCDKHTFSFFEEQLFCKKSAPLISKFEQTFYKNVEKEASRQDFS